jgi:hypothetical protein
MRNLIILALFSLVLMGCQTPPPVYSTTYNFYDFPDCGVGGKDCRPPTTSSTTKTKPKPPPPPKVEKASEFTGGGRALKPGEW